MAHFGMGVSGAGIWSRIWERVFGTMFGVWLVHFSANLATRARLVLSAVG